MGFFDPLLPLYKLAADLYYYMYKIQATSLTSHFINFSLAPFCSDAYILYGCPIQLRDIFIIE